MAAVSRFIDVQEPLVGDIDAVLVEIRAALREGGVAVADDDLAYERPEGVAKGAFGGFGIEDQAVVFVGAIVSTKVTEKYVEEVLWPRLKPKFEQVTDALWAFLQELGGSLPR